MEYLSDIAVGLATGAIGYGTGEAKRYLVERRNLRFLRSFWLGGSGRFKFIYPVYYGEHGEKFPKNLARIEDIAACQILVEDIRQFGAAGTLASDEETPDNESDLVLICSPRGNRLSRTVADQYRLPFTFESTPGHPSRIVKNGNLYQSGPEESGTKNDYALIARITDTTFRRKIFCLWGIRGAGTLGAARFLSEGSNLKRVHMAVGSRDFAVVIKVSYEDPRHPKHAAVESQFFMFDSHSQELTTK